MRKNLLMILLCGMMIFGLTTGCGTKKENNKKEAITQIILNKAPDDTKGLLGIVYYNPETGKECTEGEYNENLNHHLNTKDRYAPSSEPNRNYQTVTGLTTGCMKWYVYDETNTTYTMILDHDTTARVQYNSTNNNTVQKEVFQAFTEDTKNWKAKARLITADEIANITGNTGFDSLTASNESTFHLGGDGDFEMAKVLNINYSWLFDNTYNCEEYGCKVSDNNFYASYEYTKDNNIDEVIISADRHKLGYWTSTPVSDQPCSIWYVSYFGVLTFSDAKYGDFAIRPVITISK